MKYTIATAFVALAVAQVATAVTTITASNAQIGGTITQIIDNSGDPVVSGQVLIGTFADTAGLGTAAAGDVLTGFTQFGGAGSFSTNALAPGTFGVLDSLGITADLPNTGDAPGDLVGKTIFAVATDGSDYIVWESAATFAFEDPTLDQGPPIGFNVTDSATLLRGIVIPGGNKGLGLPGGNGQDAVTFIPEPSTSLLAGLAGLGFLIRRKR